MRYELRVTDWHKFWSKVDAWNGTDCWLWKGFIDGKGYGRFSVKSVIPGRSMISESAYRIAWQLGRSRGIPAGMHVLHSCDNPACVRPEHLRLGTHAENMRDMAERGRANGGNAGGEACGQSKLTWAQVRKIKALFSTHSNAELGPMFGVTSSTISYIRCGKTWRSDPTDTPQDNHAGTASCSDGSSPAPAASPLAGGPRAGETESALASSPARTGSAQ